MIWHPHTEPPGETNRSILALPRHHSIGGYYIAGQAINRRGQWVSEGFLEPIAPPYWWLDEADLVALIPKEN